MVLGRGGRETSTIKRRDIPFLQDICKASRTANWRSIASEFFGFGELPLQLRPTTVRIFGISIASPNQHFFRWLSLKSHHRNDLSVLCMCTKAHKFASETALAVFWGVLLFVAGGVFVWVFILSSSAISII